jgi:hemolysin activation/secretion protein
LSASLDDSGTKATGKHQGSVTLSVDNLAMLNDLFYITSNGSLGKDSSDHATRGQTLHYSFPIGYWTIGATTSSSRYFQHVAGLNEVYKYSGESENNDIKLSRLVWRDSQHKTTVALKVFQRKSSNYIDDTEVDVQRRVVGGWESSINHKASLDGATIEGNLSYKRGERVFGSLPAPEESFGEGTSLFALYAADATLTVPFQWVDQKWRFNSNWRGQKHHSPLTPQDRFSIGGRFSVRGFDGETILSAESGWVLRNDLGLTLGDSGQELYVGLDQGEVSGPSADLLVGHRLTGAVLGLRGGIGKAQYDIFFGAPVTKPDAFRTSATTAGFSLNLSF